MELTPSDVELEVMQRPDRTLYYQLTVRGKAKPKTLMVGILEHGKVTKEELAIMTLAGALAEELIARVGDDQLDPDMVANTAGAAYRELMAENPHIKPGNELPRDADGDLATGRVVLH